MTPDKTETDKLTCRLAIKVEENTVIATTLASKNKNEITTGKPLEDSKKLR
jgi:hypothetical protein